MKHDSSFELAGQLALVILAIGLGLVIGAAFLLIWSTKYVGGTLVTYPDYKALWYAVGCLLASLALVFLTGSVVALLLVTLSTSAVFLLAYLAKAYEKQQAHHPKELVIDEVLTPSLPERN